MSGSNSRPRHERTLLQEVVVVVGSSALSTKIRIISCHGSCCVFIMPRAVLFFPASCSVCCLFVRCFTATLPIHEFVSLCFLWYSPRVACILFYFAYCVELNLTLKGSDDLIPKSLSLLVPIADRLSPVFPCLFGVCTFLMSSI